ncbi:unnamed protein product [Prorocentrum cordatum]|uniref:Glycerophosphocholine acyltransferase 1 n=1 Tax=Prorocentrum cordatum TaxID=2364126 RepID=A0ABN9RAZ2_9DINO|nr:unnamed protein product [Polarella glacialis]
MGGRRGRRSRLPAAAAACAAAAAASAAEAFSAPPQGAPPRAAGPAPRLGPRPPRQPGATGLAASPVPFTLLGLTSEQLLPVQIAGLLSWALLVFFPGWKGTKSLALLGPVFFALIYAAAIVHSIRGPVCLSLEAFLSGKAFAGWLHCCAFDPLVGLGEVLDARIKRVPHLLVVPCLVLTCCFGPVGFLAYLLVRSVWLLGRWSFSPRGVRGFLLRKWRETRSQR